MPKSKKRKRGSGVKSTGPGYGANIGKTSGKTNLIAVVVAILVVGAGGVYWWNSSQSAKEIESEVATLAEDGQAKLDNVRSVRAQGSEHLAIGQSKNYVEPFPTSGDHASSSINAGFYSREMPKINLVHNLEHGNIVIYYDNPGDAAMAKLKGWATLYTSSMDGVVAVPSPGLGEAIVLTAWTKLMRLETFDEAAAAAFMDAYRGRGPEGRVR
jgi:type II secretory pathway pseudopilin PulG